MGPKILRKYFRFKELPRTLTFCSKYPIEIHIECLILAWQPWIPEFDTHLGTIRRSFNMGFTWKILICTAISVPTTMITKSSQESEFPTNKIFNHMNKLVRQAHARD